MSTPVDMRFELIDQNPFALAYINDQNDELCLKAVKRDGFAIQHVTKQTLAICLAAVNEYDVALEYVNDEFKEECEKWLERKEIANSDKIANSKET